MHTVMSLVALAALVGCSEKKPNKQVEPPPAANAAWIERLPQVADGHTKLLLEGAAGLVGIAADGKLSFAPPPAQAAPDPGRLAADPVAGASRVEATGVAKALGLPPVAARASAGLVGFERAGEPPANENPADALSARLAHPVEASGAPAPAKRATTAFGLVHEHDVTAGVVVFADANAPATALVDVLAQTGGFVAVRRGDQLGALPLAFDRQAPAPTAPDRGWVEVRLGTQIAVEVVPAPPIAIDSLDKLADAVLATRATAVDLLVAPETKAHEVIAAVGRLRAAKVEAIGLGRTPGQGSPEAAARGAAGPRVIAWDFVMPDPDGTSDPAAFRAAIDARLEPLRACYQAASTKAPGLAGAARVQLWFRPKAVAVEVHDVAPALASCVTGALEAAKVPAAPSAGAGATMRLSFLPR